MQFTDSEMATIRTALLTAAGEDARQIEFLKSLNYDDEDIRGQIACCEERRSCFENLYQKLRKAEPGKNLIQPIGHITGSVRAFPLADYLGNITVIIQYCNMLADKINEVIAAVQNNNTERG